MRSWLLTNTTYGTWLPGDERGSVTSVRDFRMEDSPSHFRIEHDQPHTPYELPLPGLERQAELNMSGAPIFLNLAMAEQILDQFQATCTHRKRRLRAVAIMYNHWHAVLQVPDDPDPARMLADLKAWASRRLNEMFGVPESEKWWTEKGSKRKLPHDKALHGAIHYVLYEQPSPLVVWSDTEGRLV